MEQVLLYGSYFCFALGSFFVLSSAVGLVRMPDFFSRLHPAGISDSIGLPLILLAIMLQSEFGFVTAKIFLIIIFSMLTSSTACHALSKSALLSGLKPLGVVHKRKSNSRSGATKAARRNGASPRIRSSNNNKKGKK